jgi:coniferyl-aldehyde dehydrogenase
MNAPQEIPQLDDITERMTAVLDAQRADYLAEGAVSAEVRIDRLQRGIDGLIKYQDQFVAALNTDFSCRPRQASLLTDVAASIAGMKHSIKHLRKWMKA